MFTTPQKTMSAWGQVARRGAGNVENLFAWRPLETHRAVG
jgi:hypothetical protein